MSDMIRWGGLWKGKTKAGKFYLSGRFGGVKLLVLALQRDNADRHRAMLGHGLGSLLAAARQPQGKAQRQQPRQHAVDGKRVVLDRLDGQHPAFDLGPVRRAQQGEQQRKVANPQNRILHDQLAIPHRLSVFFRYYFRFWENENRAFHSYHSKNLLNSVCTFFLPHLQLTLYYRRHIRIRL